LGTLLALGLCYGLLQVGMACLNALGIDATSGALDPLTGLILFQGLQVVGVLGGGILAGAGQERGSVLGGLVGILTGVGVLTAMLSGAVASVVQSYSHELLSTGSPTYDLIMFGLPVQHMIVGAIGGLIGGLIWKPLPACIDPRYEALMKRSSARREPTQYKGFRWAGPIAWLRVAIGTALAVVGALNAPTIVDFVLRFSDNKLRVITHLENQVAYGEVFGLSILLGGFFAGATRINGLKQGVCVGMLVAIILVGALHRQASDVSAVVFPILTALFLAPVGGWFGSELLPPVSKKRFRVRFWS
jgi:hypothetical protein